MHTQQIVAALVWTENSILAFRRAFSGGAEAAEPANISLVCLGQASESTIGPFISDRPGESGVPNSGLSLGTGWLTRTAVTIRAPLDEDFMDQAAAR